jgi:hypothetical protein
MSILTEMRRLRSIMGLSEEVEVGNLYLTDEEVTEIMSGYLEAAIWTEEERLKDEYESNKPSDEYDDPDDYEDTTEKIVKQSNQQPSQQFQGFSVADIDPDSRIQAYVDIKKFILTVGDAAASEAIDDQGLKRLGMDIWLSRNGHGSGFFDHSYENEEILMGTARNLGGVDLYLGDDNKLYFSNGHK